MYHDISPTSQHLFDSLGSGGILRFLYNRRLYRVLFDPLNSKATPPSKDFPVDGSTLTITLLGGHQTLTKFLSLKKSGHTAASMLRVEKNTPENTKTFAQRLEEFLV